MKSKLRIYSILVLICMAASCSRVPKHILSEKKMRSVLYDMQMAEALVEMNNEAFKVNDDRQRVYDGVFTKHKITQAEYDSSLVWYGAHMDLYMSIYKLVLRDVNEHITALGDIKPNPLSGEVSAKDSVDVWIYNRNFTFNPERAYNALTFDIKPQKPYSSGSSYVFGMSVWGVSRNWMHKPRIHISAVQADTIVSVNEEISGDGYHEVVLETVATKQVIQVYGYVIMNDIDASYHRIYLDDIQLMKYNYGSTALTAPKADSTPSDSIPADPAATAPE